jgi:hypothetical protein
MVVEIRRLLDAGDLRPAVDNMVPFSQASEAYTGTVKRTGRGKLVGALVEAASVHMHASPVVAV